MPSPDLLEIVYHRMQKQEKPLHMSKIRELYKFPDRAVTFSTKFPTAQGFFAHTDEGNSCVQLDWKMDIDQWNQIFEYCKMEAQLMLDYTTIKEWSSKATRARARWLVANKRWPQVSPGPLLKSVNCREGEPLLQLELQDRLLRYGVLQRKPSESCKARS